MTSRSDAEGLTVYDRGGTTSAQRMRRSLSRAPDVPTASPPTRRCYPQKCSIRFETRCRTGKARTRATGAKPLYKRLKEAEARLGELLSIRQNYPVLFLQGGASRQFAMIPLNLAKSYSIVDYPATGVWSKKAVSKARRYCQVRVVDDEAESKYT